MPLEKRFHVAPVHEAFEKLKAIKNYRVVFLILRSTGTQWPDFYTKVLDGLFHILLVFVGVEKDSLESSPLAFKDRLAGVG